MYRMYKSIKVHVIYSFIQAWSANYWVDRGTPKDKLIIGLATYGRGFMLTNPSEDQPGSSALGASPPGDFTGEEGFYSYYEVSMQSIFE